MTEPTTDDERPPTFRLLANLRTFASELDEQPTPDEMDESGPHDAHIYAKRFGSWNDALKAAGLVDTHSIPIHALLRDLRRVADEIGQVPTVDEYDDLGEYSYQTHLKRFGGWSEAVEASGLVESYDTGYTGNIANDELLDDLRRVADELDHPPSIYEYDDLGEYNHQTIDERFDGWENALEKVGINKESWYAERRRRTKSQFIAALGDLADNLGRPPSPMDMRFDSEQSPGTAWSAFDSWKDALEAANLDTDYTPVPRTEQAKAMVVDIRRVGNGESPSLKEYHSEGDFPKRRIRRTFGSWTAALRAAGLEGKKTEKVSRVDLQAEIRRLADELGRPPTTIEMNEHGEYSQALYQNEYGSWKAAVEAAGLDTEEMATTSVTDEELLDDLRRVADDLGRPPNTTEYKERGEYSPPTYSNHFGRWRDAIESAGLDPDGIPDERKIPDEQLLDDLRRVANDLGHRPTTTEYKDSGEYAVRTLSERFDGWGNALSAADLRNFDTDAG